MTPMLKLAHALCFDPYPSIREWKRTQELARKALAEHDQLRAEAARLRRAVAQMPKFQGMTELA